MTTDDIEMVLRYLPSSKPLAVPKKFQKEEGLYYMREILNTYKDFNFDVGKDFIVSRFITPSRKKQVAQQLAQFDEPLVDERQVTAKMLLHVWMTCNEPTKRAEAFKAAKHFLSGQDSAEDISEQLH